eukprot:jgi/Tetstr1/420342/TSEL_011462.t1
MLVLTRCASPRPPLSRKQPRTSKKTPQIRRIARRAVARRTPRSRCVSGRTTETGGKAKQRLRRSGSATTRPKAAAPQPPGSKMREAAKLYRAILKEAARFPSTKRAAIIEDIKFEFHKNKVLTSAAEIKNQMRLANESLEQLKNYNNLSGPESSLYLKGPCQQG